MRAPGVILVEGSPYESALAYLALTREISSVIQVPDLRAARRVVDAGMVPVGLAILGRRAIARASDREIRALQVPAVGIAPNLSRAERRRGLAAGLRAVYARPRRWKAYLALLGRVLATQDLVRRDLLTLLPGNGRWKLRQRSGECREQDCASTESQAQRGRSRSAARRTVAHLFERARAVAG